MKKATPFLFLLLCVILISSCKKKSSIEPTPSGNFTSSGNYAVFMSRKQVIITNTLVSSYNNSSIAYVSNAALIDNSPAVGSLLNMGTVNLNGTFFKKDAYGAENIYGDTTTLTYNTPHNWVVSGSVAVAGFSFTNTNNYPVYTGYTAIADSFTVSGNISIPLINYSGVDEIETYFVTTTNPPIHTSMQSITGSPTSLNFTSTDLGVIGVNSNVALIINLYKNNVQVINGKSYNFRTGCSVIKSNIKFK